MRFWRRMMLVSAVSYSAAAAAAPQMLINQEIDFGTLIPGTGSCRMIPTTGALTFHQGNFLCELSDGAHNGSYTLIVDPNTIVRFTLKQNLNSGQGYVFNPMFYIQSDAQAKSLFDRADYIEVNSGSSGVINLSLGGDLYVNSPLPNNSRFTFTWDDGLVWEVVP